MKKIALGLAALLASAGAQAAVTKPAPTSGGGSASFVSDAGHFDLTYIFKTDLDGVDDGSGFGVGAYLPLQSTIGENATFLRAEYQKSTTDEFDVDVKQVRLGGGIRTQGGVGFYVDYVKIDLNDVKVDGFGLHARLASDNAEALNFYGELGYNLLEADAGGESIDADGIEFVLGGSYRFGPTMSFFGDYRNTSLDDTELSDLRVGVRFDLN